ncbi:ribonuclease H-like superfamily protein [Striga asiatica]|uniref:Ribonuclease H-like superfamily protein n=1 Tax=Striga asiatica TaxID=4170 RepID=A0A5A7P8T0_STRAF|nr:ribonuclease H-like superfamily protein [Striga asiatica]
MSESATVDTLIVEHSGKWNVPLVRSIFPNIEADAILSLALPQNHFEDKWIWHFSKNGKFSVRSAYFQLLNSPIYASHLASITPQPLGVRDRVWCMIWKLKLPHRIHLLVWRLYLNVLPTPDNLACRNVTFDGTCPLCSSVASSSMHTFFDCSFTLQALRIAGLLVLVRQLQKETCETWCRNLLLHMTSPHIEFLVAIWDGIWQARNGVIFQQRTVRPWNIVLNASRTVAEFASHSLNPEMPDPALSYLPTSVVPSDDATRIYFDGSISPNRVCGGSGVFARSANGVFLQALSRRFDGIVDADLAEALAMREAILLAQRLNVPNVAVMEDSSLIVQASFGLTDAPSSCSPVIDDIVACLSHLPSVKLFWIPRSENVVAHSLARHATSSSSSISVWSDPPNFLSHLVLDHFQ